MTRDCDGYQAAYEQQQYDNACYNDPLYDAGCPDIQAYYDQQCSADVFYDSGLSYYWDIKRHMNSNSMSNSVKQILFTIAAVMVTQKHTHNTNTNNNVQQTHCMIVDVMDTKLLTSTISVSKTHYTTSLAQAMTRRISHFNVKRTHCMTRNVRI